MEVGTPTQTHDPGHLRDQDRVVDQGQRPHVNAGPSRPPPREAERWDGFGTALKPAWEPIVLIRKPVKATYAETALEHGCGALDIDGARIGTARRTSKAGRMRKKPGSEREARPIEYEAHRPLAGEPRPREEVAALLDEQTGEGKHGADSRSLARAVTVGA